MRTVDVWIFGIMSRDHARVHDSLTNDKIYEKSKLKAFADDKINVAQMMISLSYRVEKIVGKGERSIFSFSHEVDNLKVSFPGSYEVDNLKVSFPGSYKVWFLW